MSAVDVGRVMTADQARALTDRIKGALYVAWDGLIEAWQGRADQALGYASWETYCGAEFAEARMVRLAREQRQEIVAQMRSAGMSTRAIGSGLGIGNKTAARDVASVSGDTDDAATVTSLDGRRRPAAAPRPDPAPEPSGVRAINAGTPQSVIDQRQAESDRALPAFGIRMAIDDLLSEADDPETVVRDCPDHARGELVRVPEALAFLTALHQAMEAHR